MGKIKSAIAIIIFGTPGVFAWGPWSTSAQDPVVRAAHENRFVDEALTSGPAGHAFELLLTVYQQTLSPMLVNRCSMHPSCSRYSRHALRKHGPFIGVILTTDRLIHESDEQRYVPKVFVHHKIRFLDPVSNNDFWWYHE